MVYTIGSKSKNYFKSAVLVGKNKIRIEKLLFQKLSEGQVLVKNHFAGICHTQLLEFEGKRGLDKFLPHCFGHEAVSTVVALGENIKKVKVGDDVVVSWLKGTGSNVNGGYYLNTNKKNINFGPVSVFSEYSILSENRVYKVSNKISKKNLSFLGCAVPTGMGSLVNYIKNKNDKICILGSGGIGTFSCIAAYFLKCRNVHVLDINKKKLNIPKKLNQIVFHINNNSKEEEFYKRFNNYFDLVIECTGSIDVMSKAILLTKPLTGKLIINGNAPYKSSLKINPIQFNMGKSIIGSWGGGSKLDLDLKNYINKISKLNFNLSSHISKVYKLSNIKQAFEDLKKGKVIRPLIKF